MRTTLDVDEKLLEKAMEFSQKKTKAAAVNEALASYVRMNKIQKILDLEGKIRIDDNWRELEQVEMEEQKRDVGSRR